MNVHSRTSESSNDIRQDPVIIELLGRFPSEISASFSDVQLTHLKDVMGARNWGEHKVDFRSSFRLWRITMKSELYC